MPDKTTVSDSLGALDGEDANLDFGLSDINFDSMNQGIHDILGVKSGTDPLFEGYKAGAVSRLDFDRELAARLESVVEQAVDPGKFARGDFSLPKAYTAEMLSIVSAYTGVPLEAFYNNASESEILSNLLEQQRIENERKAAAQQAQELAERQAAAQQAQELAERQAAEEAKRISDENERLRQQKLTEEEAARRRLEEAKERSADENTESCKLSEEDIEILNPTDEDTKRLQMRRANTHFEDEKQGQENIESLISDSSTEDIGDLKEECIPNDDDEAPQPKLETISFLPDDEVQDMDISTELNYSLKTDVYSLDTLVTNRDKGKI